MYPFYYWNPWYFVFTLPALALALYAQWKVRSAYGKYSRIPNERGISGYQAAQELLRANGLFGVDIEGIPGDLSDHYDPRGKVLRLSAGVADSRSVAALGIVAHEVGHAVQDARGYAPLRVRSALVPAANIGSSLGIWLFVIGLLLNFTTLAWLGVILFSAAAAFALVTLPVELNASRRALDMLRNQGMLGRRDLQGARSVLNAAALTYVAALAQALSQLLYFLFILSGRERD